MPTDKTGRFHGNVQRAIAADKNAPFAPKSKPPVTSRMAAAPPMEPDGDESGAGEHLKAFHDAMGGGKAMLIHHDGINATSHQIGEDGEVSGPHDHANIEELKASMEQFLNEEESEPSAEMGMAGGHLKDVY